MLIDGLFGSNETKLFFRRLFVMVLMLRGRRLVLFLLMLRGPNLIHGSNSILRVENG